MKNVLRSLIDAEAHFPQPLILYDWNTAPREKNFRGLLRPDERGAVTYVDWDIPVFFAGFRRHPASLIV
jgi:hypothetical protein